MAGIMRRGAAAAKALSGRGRSAGRGATGARRSDKSPNKAGLSTANSERALILWVKLSACRASCLRASACLAGDGDRKPSETRGAGCLLRLPLHRRRFRVLELQPVRRAARPVTRAQPLTDDPLQPHLAGVSPIRGAAAAEQAPATVPQPLINREEPVQSETDRQQLKRYFLQNWRDQPRQ
jgi:hypothetical protein